MKSVRRFHCPACNNRAVVMIGTDLKTVECDECGGVMFPGDTACDNCGEIDQERYYCSECQIWLCQSCFLKTAHVRPLRDKMDMKSRREK